MVAFGAMSGYRPDHVVLLPGIMAIEASWDLLVPHLPDGPEVHRAVYPAVDDLLALADAVLADLPGRFALVGHSFGGQVALAVHHQAPERVENLVVVAQTDGPELDAIVTGTRSVLDEHGFDGVVAGFIQNLGLEGDAADLADGRMREYGEARFRAHGSAALTRPDWSASLDALAVPSLFVGLTDDQMIPAEGVRALAARATGSTYVEIPDCGHAVHVERPAELAAAIVGWWDALG